MIKILEDTYLKKNVYSLVFKLNSIYTDIKQILYEEFLYAEENICKLYV